MQNLIKPNGFIIWAPIPFSINTVNYALSTPAPSPPTFDNLLGTDDQGRDVLTRSLYGFRISILFGLALTIGASIIGIFTGSLQGYFGGRFDLLMQRFIEIWSNLRAEFFRTRTLDYVRAAEALGVPSSRIIWRHMLPNAMVAVITYLPFILNGSIATLTSLDFLGFGLPPGSASLGELITQAKNNIQAPWLGLTAFFSISVLLSLLIFTGEAVRDAFDSRKIKIG